MAPRGELIPMNCAGVGGGLCREVMITGISAGDPAEVILLTADGDHYQFNLAPGDDVEAVYWIGMQGGHPAHVPENMIYRFRQHVPSQERNRLSGEAQGMLGAPLAPPPGPQAQPLRNAQLPGLGRPAGVGARRADAGRAWVYAEDYGSHQTGEIIEELRVGHAS
ncbi:unnamed protein product [Prorocentrum cordatum]|uniref:Uncharacterized protein n=1 Tax=Prorocentrum cordatum TaxID=2364126 RepID=A0ABN9T492_9DINO|nr:unnamed protein product [Polarella glacialis]